MKCPVCRAVYTPNTQHSTPNTQYPTPTCRRCGLDLSPLIQLHDQAVWYHHQAIAAFNAGDYPTATRWNNQAVALHSTQADFHLFAGQLWALQGDLALAIAAWKKALHLNPQHPALSKMKIK